MFWKEFFKTKSSSILTRPKAKQIKLFFTLAKPSKMHVPVAYNSNGAFLELQIKLLGRFWNDLECSCLGEVLVTIQFSRF